MSGFLIVSFLAGPLLAVVLAEAEGVSVGELMIRLALVVLIPLVTGAGARALYPKLVRLEPEFSAARTLTLVALVYAALSGVGGETSLGSARC